MHELQDLADILQIFLQLKPSFAAFWLGVPTMSQLFLSNLTLADFDGKFQLYLSDRALRFSDSGEQNMMIIPRNSVAAVKVRHLADVCVVQIAFMLTVFAGMGLRELSRP